MKRLIELSAIETQASVRPDGYREDVLSKGVIKDNRYLEIEWDEYLKLVDKYKSGGRKRRSGQPCNGCGGAVINGIKGLGDLVASVAQPIAKAIDAVAGTDIENCESCKKRRAKLNAMLSFTGSK